MMLKELLDIFIWPIDETLTGTTIPGQSWPGSNGNEGCSAFPKAPGQGASPLNIV